MARWRQSSLVAFAHLYKKFNYFNSIPQFIMQIASLHRQCVCQCSLYGSDNILTFFCNAAPHWRTALHNARKVFT